MAITETFIRRLEHIALTAAEAGAAHHAEVDFATEAKGKVDVVTTIDLASERAVFEVLRRSRPDDSILGEEGTDVVGSSDVRWIIDPLDGTANFVQGSPHRALSIGVWVEGIPAVGVVIDSGRGDVFTGSVVSPARRNGEVIRVAEAPPEHAIIGTGFSRESDRREFQASVLAGLLPDVADIRRTGSPALDLCSVAAGWTHGFYEGPLGLWDYAGGEVIVRAAGGDVVSAFDGRHNILIAGSRDLVTWLRQRLAA